MKDELLKAEDMNVFVVDWAGGSLPLYTQATANTRLVGLELGHFISHLVKNDVSTIKSNLKKKRFSKRNTDWTRLMFILSVTP